MRPRGRCAQWCPPRNRHDWQRWSAIVALPTSGAAVIRARATDENGVSQPDHPTLWNPGGDGGSHPPGRDRGRIVRDPEKPARTLIRGGNRFSERSHSTEKNVARLLSH
jgi:hypothetical protein